MPEQVKRLLVFFLILIGGLALVRYFLVPSTFGKYGHYRADAIKSEIQKEFEYAGERACTECHDDISGLKRGSFHKDVACESCHGPAYKHTQAPDEFVPPVPRKRGYCSLCHAYNPSRPIGFPQINPVTHNPLKPCISCHNPHDPTPPHVPGECRACHAQIYRTKMLSPHALLECTECHETPEKHRLTPRTVRPSKPQRREFCGKCHSPEAKPPKEIEIPIPRVDFNSHEYKYKCWQCHYPHYPEAHKKG